MGLRGARYRCSIVVDGEELWKRSFWVLGDAERWAAKRFDVILSGESGHISISDGEGELMRLDSRAAGDEAGVRGG